MLPDESQSRHASQHGPIGGSGMAPDGLHAGVGCLGTTPVGSRAQQQVPMAGSGAQQQPNQPPFQFPQDDPWAVYRARNPPNGSGTTENQWSPIQRIMEVTRQFHDVEAQNSPPRQCEPVQPTGLSGYQGQVPLGTPSFCGSPVGSNMFGGAACSNGPPQYYMGSPNAGSTISGNVGNLGTAQCGQCSNRSVPHELFGNAYGQQARSGEHVLNLHGVPHGPLGVSHGFGSVSPWTFSQCSWTWKTSK